jgi:CRISPR system Cascade subunit CasB
VNEAGKLSVSFIDYLQKLKSENRGALATLRHSLAFAPGMYPRALPYVERFVNQKAHEHDAHRLALYAVAALFARHPAQTQTSFAAAFGELPSRRASKSIEQRFITLLEADAENIVDYLRQAISLLAADNIGCNYTHLLEDLSIWMNRSANPERRNRLRQRWARDFYSAIQPAPESQPSPETAAAQRSQS